MVIEENIINILYKVFGITSFVVAISLFIIMYNQSNRTIEIMNERTGFNNQVSKRGSSLDFDNNKIEGSLLISSIYHGLEVPIEIHADNKTILISVEVMGKDFFEQETSSNKLVIHEDDIYEEQLLINQEGKLLTIIYKKVD